MIFPNSTNQYRPATKSELEDALDAWLDGVYDDAVGSIDYGPGHVFRVGTIIVMTIFSGATTAWVCDSETSAQFLLDDWHSRYYSESEQ